MSELWGNSHWGRTHSPHRLASTAPDKTAARADEPSLLLATEKYLHWLYS